MEVGSSKADKARSYNGLVSLVQSITGLKTTVDLRDGSSVTGNLVQTDSFMNITMSNVLYRDGAGLPHIFETFFVHNRNIRYVHIPVEVDMIKSIENFFERSKVSRARPENTGFKQRRLLKRQAETMKMVEHINAEKQGSR